MKRVLNSCSDQDTTLEHNNIQAWHSKRNLFDKKINPSTF